MKVVSVKSWNIYHTGNTKVGVDHTKNTLIICNFKGDIGRKMMLVTHVQKDRAVPGGRSAVYDELLFLQFFKRDLCA